MKGNLALITRKNIARRPLETLAAGKIELIDILRVFEDIWDEAYWVGFQDGTLEPDRDNQDIPF